MGIIKRTNIDIYVKLQTNRVSLMKYLNSFQANLVVGEKLIAPRPKPGELVQYYIAYLIVKKGSKNYLAIQNFKGYAEINKEKFQRATKSITHSWTIE